MSDTMAARPLLHSIETAQTQLGNIGRTMFYELIKSGEIQTVKIGRRTFVTQSQLEAYVDRISGVAV